MHRRRILHYAAAGLLGWYLMVPPVSHTEQFQVDEHAPLGQWLVFEAFDNAKDCNDAQVRRASADKAKATANPKTTEQTVANAMIASQCIASDDPRLKEGKR
jgi:hypothetical protein